MTDRDDGWHARAGTWPRMLTRARVATHMRAYMTTHTPTRTSAQASADKSTRARARASAHMPAHITQARVGGSYSFVRANEQHRSGKRMITGTYSYGLYSSGLQRYGLYDSGLYSYGLYSYDSIAEGAFSRLGAVTVVTVQ